MIIVKLQGGLGNQLFQYAIGKRLSMHYNTELKLDTSFLSPSGNEKVINITPRSYELHQLSINAEIATDRDVTSFSNSGRLLHRINKYFTQSMYIKEKSFLFDSTFLSYGKNCYLDGYWQCENYFIDIAADLRKEFNGKLKMGEKNSEMKASIDSCNAVSVHIRRGDYISNVAAQQFHGTCSVEYYKQAVDLVATKCNNPHFFIFSDDVKWVVDNFKISFPTTIVNINDSKSAIFDMKLMSCCKHNIIANSSFSWWGAWLGNFNGKIVVGPKAWFADLSIDTSTLLPENWYKL